MAAIKEVPHVKVGAHTKEAAHVKVAAHIKEAAHVEVAAHIKEAAHIEAAAHIEVADHAEVAAHIKVVPHIKVTPHIKEAHHVKESGSSPMNRSGAKDIQPAQAKPAERSIGGGTCEPCKLLRVKTDKTTCTKEAPEVAKTDSNEGSTYR